MGSISNEETGTTASAILNNLISFMEQLAASGMEHKDIVSRGYDFALAKLRSKADMELRQGSEISATMLAQIMDHAADLLKAAVGRGIEKQSIESRNILGTGRVEKWKCSETIPEPPLEAEILHNGKYYKGVLGFDREDC